MIRPARSEDLESIKGCAEAAYAPYVERIGKRPAPMVADFKARIEAGDLYVAEADGNLIGFIVFFPRRDHLHIENVAVLPSSQGQGLGKSLIAYAEQEARHRGIGAVELYTNVKMTENLEFYPKLGYIEIDRRKEDGFSRVFFRKVLSR